MNEQQMEEERQRRAEAFRRRFQLAAPQGASGGEPQSQTVVRKGDKVGRNDPCPCGSGKKYKKCHGATVAAS